MLTVRFVTLFKATATHNILDHSYFSVFWALQTFVLGWRHTVHHSDKSVKSLVHKYVSEWPEHSNTNSRLENNYFVIWVISKCIKMLFWHYLYLSTPIFKFIANSKKKMMLKLHIINKWNHAVFISPKTMELQEPNAEVLWTEHLSFILQMSHCSLSIVIRQVQATLYEAQIETDLDRAKLNYSYSFNKEAFITLKCHIPLYLQQHHTAVTVLEPLNAYMKRLQVWSLLELAMRGSFVKAPCGTSDLEGSVIRSVQKPHSEALISMW